MENPEKIAQLKLDMFRKHRQIMKLRKSETSQNKNTENSKTNSKITKQNSKSEEHYSSENA